MSEEKKLVVEEFKEMIHDLLAMDVIEILPDGRATLTQRGQAEGFDWMTFVRLMKLKQNKGFKERYDGTTQKLFADASAKLPEMSHTAILDGERKAVLRSGAPNTKEEVP